MCGIERRYIYLPWSMGTVRRANMSSSIYLSIYLRCLSIYLFICVCTLVDGHGETGEHVLASSLELSSGDLISNDNNKNNGVGDLCY